MKKLILTLLSLFLIAGMYSQTINLVDENFNGTTIPDGWETYNLGDPACNSENWTFGSGNIPGTTSDFSTNAAIFNDDSYGNDGNHNKSCLYMLDPATNYGYDLSGYAGPVTLYYDYAFSNNNGELLQVVIWDNTALEWIVLKTYGTDSPPTSDSVNIRAAMQNNSGINPSFVYIGFIYDDVDGEWGLGAGVDNVKLEVYEAPDNDDCLNALYISNEILADGYYSVDMDASGATNNSGNITLCADGMNDGVWYYFTAYYDGSVTVDVQPDASFDPQIGIYEGDDCTSLTCVGTVDNGLSGGDPETITFDVVSGTKYYINVGHWGGSFDAFEGPFHMDVTFNCNGLSVPNDLIADAIEITNPVFSDTVNVPCANAETGTFQGCLFYDLKTAFYKFHTTASSTVVAQILNPAGISGALFFEAPSLNATESELIHVDQTTNPCSIGDTYSIVTDANKDYYVVLTNGSETTITINGVENNTGISDQTIAGLKIYPNPVEDLLNIQSPDDMKEISVYNIAGQEVYHTAPGDVLVSIPAGEWATGTYIVKIITGDNTGVYHIMKE